MQISLHQVCYKSAQPMKKENEEGGWKNHSSRIGVTHKVIFFDKPISWITQVTKEIHSHTLEGD